MVLALLPQHSPMSQGTAAGRFDTKVARSAHKRSIAGHLLTTVMACAGALGLVAPAAADTPARSASGAVAAPGASAKGVEICPPILDRTLPRLQDDAPQNLCQFSGKVVLVVNTASYCGFTGQYEGLEALYRRYRDRGLVILGFPSNDFSQEPGSSKEIAELCFNTYGIKFPMFAKTSVVGAQADPLFVELARQSSAPKWNFYKYLIGRDGKVLGSYSSLTGPLDGRLTRDVEQALRR
jgi:glutathione peroxidase